MAAKRVLILPDIHFPHHDEDALAVALGIRRRWKPDLIIQLGDAMDFGAFSSHALQDIEDPVDFLRDEVVPYNAYVDKLQGRAHTPFVQLEGNHEHRLRRWLLKSGGPAINALARTLSVERLISQRADANGLPRRPRKNFEFVPYMGKFFHSRYQITPNLIAVHGWSTSKHASASHLDKARVFSVVHGHTHRAQVHTTRNPLTDDIYTAWSPGCLCEFVPLYMANSPNDWTRGVSCLYISKKDPTSWSRYNVTIDRGSAVLPDGSMVRA